MIFPDRISAFLFRRIEIHRIFAHTPHFVAVDQFPVGLAFFQQGSRNFIASRLLYFITIAVATSCTIGNFDQIVVVGVAFLADLFVFYDLFVQLRDESDRLRLSEFSSLHIIRSDHLVERRTGDFHLIDFLGIRNSRFETCQMRRR